MLIRPEILMDGLLDEGWAVRAAAEVASMVAGAEPLVRISCAWASSF